MTNNNTNWGNFTGQNNGGGFQVNPAGQQGGQQQDQPVQPAQPVQPVAQPQAAPVQPVYQAPAAPMAPMAPVAPVAPAPQAAAAQPVAPAPAAPAPAAPTAPLAGMAGDQAAGGQQNQQKDPPGADPNYKFAVNMDSFTTIVKLPANNLSFDEAHFINLLAGSISLSKDEKKKIINSIPNLRQAQVDELIRIFEEERTKFKELSVKHAAQLKKLEKQHMEDWKDIEMEIKAESQKEEEASKVDDIKKQLGL